MEKKKKPFFGREEELAGLRRLRMKSTASMIVLRGRRRIGKSRLLEEFGKGMKTISISGVVPTKKTTAQGQRDYFAGQMVEQLKKFPIAANSWMTLFTQLAKYTAKGPVLIILDEISWLGSKDPDFLGLLKNAWDTQFSQNPRLILALCGSISPWIEKNILSNTGFLGRISHDLALQELSLHESSLFWGKRRERTSSSEIFKALAVTGGIPKYLEEIKPQFPVEDSIRTLCFKPPGLLFREFDQIFSDLFSKRSQRYARIVELLADKPSTLQEISDHLQMKLGGRISQYLHHLIVSGFVTDDIMWNLSSGKTSKLKMFRLQDNYLRFYLKYIAPHKREIEKGLFPGKSLAQLPGWNSIMGLQFENLVVNNARELFPLLKLDISDIAHFGPYFQRPTTRQKGCQIDLLIQTRFQNLFLCEIKFQAEKIGMDVVEEVKQKMQRLRVPRGYSIRPVLIAVNGVSEVVKEADFFDFIVDFSELIR